MFRDLFARLAAREKGKAKTRWRIAKYVGDFKSEEEAIRNGAIPYEVLEFKHNLLLNEGINELWTILCSSGGTKFDNTNAYIGVGDSATAESASQTGLQAATNKLYKAMDTGYPTYGSNQSATWKSTFGSSDANFAWNEITVANGNSDAAKNLNRKVQSMGTKASGTSWVATLEITLS
jgi:hypothetical protein